MPSLHATLMPNSSHISDLTQLSKEMVSAHGEVIGGSALQQCLGFRSARSFQRALHAGNLQVQTFLLPGRRGRFARTRDVALWLATLGQESAEP